MFGSGGLLPVPSTVTVTTIASDTSHPNTYAAPFRTRRASEGRTTVNAVSGSGSKAHRQADQGKVKQQHGRSSRLLPTEGVPVLGASSS